MRLGPGLERNPRPLGGETLPLVLEVYGLLNLATSGYMRNLPFNGVRLWRDRGSLEVPSGGPVAQEDDESALGHVIRLDGPTGSRGGRLSWRVGAVLRVTDTEDSFLLLGTLLAALIQWRCRLRNPPPPQPETPQKRRRQ